MSRISLVLSLGLLGAAAGAQVPTPATPEIALAPPAADFGDLAAGSSAASKVTLQSVGSTELTVSSVSLDGPDVADFALLVDTGESLLTPGATRLLVLRGAAPTEGIHHASLRIDSDALNAPVLAAPLTIVGRRPPPVSPAASVWVGSQAPSLEISAGFPPNVIAASIEVPPAVSGVVCLAEVDTAIRHSFPGDLDITLTSPAGTVVTLTTDNGDTEDNVFAGTRWSDQADENGALPHSQNPGLAVDSLYLEGRVERTLVPEEPLAAVAGERAAGLWTLRLSDDSPFDGGALDSWALRLWTLPRALDVLRTAAEDASPEAIPDAGLMTRTLRVSGAGNWVTRVVLMTDITHAFCGDLDITLASPAGTVVTITTDNGGASGGVFAGTRWEDNADPNGQVPYLFNAGLVTDSVYVEGQVQPLLTPEESLGAFVGEDPNGLWTLAIADDETGETGTLHSWRLEIDAATVGPTGLATGQIADVLLGLAPAEPSEVFDVNGDGRIDAGDAVANEMPPR